MKLVSNLETLNFHTGFIKSIARLAPLKTIFPPFILHKSFMRSTYGTVAAAPRACRSHNRLLCKLLSPHAVHFGRKGAVAPL